MSPEPSKDVEELSPETNPDLIRGVKHPLQPKIHLGRSETPQHVASEITLLACGRRGKSRAIKNLAARILRSKELKRHSRV